MTIADNLNHPWGLAFLPNGDMLITERAGTLRMIHFGTLQPGWIYGAPHPIVREEAGLMDVAVHPQFAENGLVYLTYSKEGEGNTPALFCARLRARAWLRAMTSLWPTHGVSGAGTAAPGSCSERTE